MYINELGIFSENFEVDTAYSFNIVDSAPETLNTFYPKFLEAMRKPFTEVFLEIDYGVNEIQNLSK